MGISSQEHGISSTLGFNHQKNGDLIIQNGYLAIRNLDLTIKQI